MNRSEVCCELLGEMKESSKRDCHLCNIARFNDCEYAAIQATSGAMINGLIIGV